MTITYKYPGFVASTGTVASGGTSTQSSIMDPTVSLRDSSGNVINTSRIDPNTRQAIIASTLTNGAINLTGQYNGGQGYPVTLGQQTTLHVGGSNQATAASVLQNIAGPGIYISSPNGKGNVTISTSPFPITPNKETLYDITWTVVHDNPYGIVPQFIAVGANGAVMRSRDGKNWIQLKGNGTTTVLGISSEMNSSIPDQHIEYNGVTYGGTFVYGRQGVNSDGMTVTGQLSDQSGAITEDLVSTYTFINAGGASTSTYYNDMLSYAEGSVEAYYSGVPTYNYSHSSGSSITWYAQVQNTSLQDWLTKLSNANTAPIAEVTIDGSKIPSEDFAGTGYDYAQLVRGYQIVSPALVALVFVEKAENLTVGSHSTTIKIWNNFSLYTNNPTTPAYTFNYNFTIGP